jgi:predicted house-cleaning noncanonical NTP pyrophosphatase (MazG superfamily)
MLEMIPNRTRNSKTRMLQILDFQQKLRNSFLKEIENLLINF